MKTKATVLFILIMMVFGNLSCFSQNVPQSYMEISASSEWGIFTKDMDDKELLTSVGKTKEEINEILTSSGSESLIINKKTGAQVYVKVVKNDLSYELWNIYDARSDDIKTKLKQIVYDAFMMGTFDYQDEDVMINEYPYTKFITIPGTAYISEKAHGVIAEGTIVNGNSIVFTMITDDIKPSDEEISAVSELAKSVSFTVIKEKTDIVKTNEIKEEKDVFHYILGGFGALVLVIFCVYVIMRMKSTDKEDEEEIAEEKEE